MRSLRVRCRVCVLATLLVPGLISAQSAGAPTPAADTAVVEFHVPAGATIRMGDQDYPAQKNAVFTPLEPGKIYQQVVEVRLADGTRRERSLLLRGGWHIRLVVPPPNTVRPEVVIQTGHAAPVFALAFSPDGRHLLSGSGDNSAILWDARTGRQLRRFAGFQNAVMSVGFSPDGQRVLLASLDGSVTILDSKTGRRLLNLEVPVDASLSAEVRAVMPKMPVYGAVFRPDGAMVAVAAGTKILLFDARTGTVLRSLDESNFMVFPLAFSPDGQTILGGYGGSHQGQGILWNVQTGEKVRTLSGHNDRIAAVAFSPDGRMAVTASYDKTAMVWDVQTGQALHTLVGHTNQLWAVAFSPDGRHILTGARDGAAMAWDAPTGKLLSTFRARELITYGNDVMSTAFTPESRQAVTGMATGTIVFWDLATREQQRALHALSMGITAASFITDGQQARTISGLFGLTWDAASGQPALGALKEVASIPFTPVRGFPCDQSAQRALLTVSDNEAVLVDLHTGRKVQQLQRHGGITRIVAVSHDGRWALTGSIADKKAYLWDISTGERFDLPVKPCGTGALAMSADGRYGVVGTDDASVVLFDLQTRQPLRTLQPANASDTSIDSLDISRDGRRIMAGDVRGNVIFWDAGSGQQMHLGNGHQGNPYCMVWSVAFSPDGRCAISGGADNRAVVWDVETGVAIRVLQGHGAMVTAVGISPGDRYALTGSLDGTARLWDIATGDELAKLIGMAAISNARTVFRDWLVITPEGLFDGSAGAREKVTFRVGDGLSVVPVDRFFQDFYRPGLLTAIWSGQHEMPEEKLFGSKPPTIEITAPAQNGVVESEHLVLEATVTDQGHGIKGPWLLHNGVRVLAPGKVERQGNVVRRQFQVALVEGKNQFEVRAASADGSWESEPDRRELTYEKLLPKPDVYLLAIGVGKYSDASLQLSYPTVDAEAMADLFQKRGPAFYRHVHLVKLLDEKATRSGILQAIGQLTTQARPQDTLIVFLAGQGMLIDQQYYFLPHELRRQEKTLDEAVRGQGLLAAELGEKLAAVPALKRMVIFDTGQSAATVALAKRSRNPFAFRGVIERLSRAEGAFTLAALAVSPAAREVPDLGHGVLSYTLFAGLGAADRGPLKRPLDPRRGAGGADLGADGFRFGSDAAPDQAVLGAGAGSAAWQRRRKFPAAADAGFGNHVQAICGGSRTTQGGAHHADAVANFIAGGHRQGPTSPSPGGGGHQPLCARRAELAFRRRRRPGHRPIVPRAWPTGVWKGRVYGTHRPRGDEDEHYEDLGGCGREDPGRRRLGGVSGRPRHVGGAALLLRAARIPLEAGHLGTGHPRAGASGRRVGRRHGQSQGHPTAADTRHVCVGRGPGPGTQRA